MFITGEQSAEFEALHQCLLADHQPATPAEAELVHKMVLTYWRLELIRQRQDRALNDSSQMVNVLERSQGRCERKYFKLLGTLKKLQCERLSPFRHGFVLQKSAEAA